MLCTAISVTLWNLHNVDSVLFTERLFLHTVYLNLQACRGYGYPWIYPWMLCYRICSISRYNISLSVVLTLHFLVYLCYWVKWIISDISTLLFCSVEHGTAMFNTAWTRTVLPITALACSSFLVSLQTRAVTVTSFRSCIKHQVTSSIMYTENPRLQ